MLLEESMFAFTVSRFSRSIKEREFYQKKVYLPDLGYATIFKHSKNIGRVFENFIFNELVRKQSQIYFYRNNFECDFILLEENVPIPVQVSYELKENTPSGSYQREIDSLLKTMVKLNTDMGYIITHHETKEIELKNKKISIISAIDFLLFKDKE